jgi:hypothetical protein
MEKKELAAVVTGEGEETNRRQCVAVKKRTTLGAAN